MLSSPEAFGASETHSTRRHHPGSIKDSITTGPRSFRGLFPCCDTTTMINSQEISPQDRGKPLPPQVRLPKTPPQGK